MQQQNTPHLNLTLDDIYGKGLNYANRIPKAGRILNQFTKKLGRDNQSNR